MSESSRGGQVSPARGGVSPAGGGQSSPGGVSVNWGGGGGQHLAPSCRRYASCVHAGGLSCLTLQWIGAANFN